MLFVRKLHIVERSHHQLQESLPGVELDDHRRYKALGCPIREAEVSVIVSVLLYLSSCGEL